MVKQPESENQIGDMKLVEWENQGKKKDETFTSFSVVKEAKKKAEDSDNGERQYLLTVKQLNGLSEADLRNLYQLLNDFFKEKETEA